jgi:hypothetical protein
MANCTICGEPTSLYVHDQPVCTKCDLLPFADRIRAAQQFREAQASLAAKA